MTDPIDDDLRLTPGELAELLGSAWLGDDDVQPRVELRVDDRPIPLHGATYDPRTNTVTFHGSYVPRWINDDRDDRDDREDALRYAYGGVAHDPLRRSLMPPDRWVRNQRDGPGSSRRW